jgi:hypothetical protein
MGGVLGPAEDASKRSTVIDPFEHEQRFILTRAQAATFYAAVGPRASLELYDEVRPISYTRTTYLDTDDFAYFRSCDGPVARRLRVREYASASAPSEPAVLSSICFLELKQNAGTTRSKVRLSAPPAFLQQLIDGRDGGGGAASARKLNALAGAPVCGGIEALAALTAIQAELAAAPMAPRLSTWYRRTCMTGESGRVRITLDEGLTFCRPQPLGQPGDRIEPRDVIATGPARILEIKFWGDAPEWLVRATVGLTGVPNFSKFRIGMLALAQHGAAPTLPEARTITPATLFVLAGLEG